MAQYADSVTDGGADRSAVEAGVSPPARQALGTSRRASTARA